MAEDGSENLGSDQKRQAVHTLRGFSYQIWQSVYRWVNLKDGEVLFLEGAEDIDFHGPGRAETIQVKENRRSGPVTLQTKDVLEAIGHFWEHQKNNPAITVTFRFLTTAERGHEKSRHFGDVRGLDHWESCKYPSTKLDLIRSFLREQTILPDGLRAFVASSSDDELRQRLIRRVEWDTGNKPQPLIEELVNDKVAAYGDRVYSLPPSESVKVVSHLLKHAWDVVIRKENRLLTYADFMRVFEEVTTARISRHELEYLRSAARVAASSGGGATLGGALGVRPLPESIFETITPPLKDRLVQRSGLISTLHARLNHDGILVLKGSTGMGKSTLANAVANADDGSWRRLDMRGRTPEQILERLSYAARAVGEYAAEANYIIDDLNFDRQPALYENSLAKFIYAVILQTGRIIITTQGTLPSRVANLHDLPAGCVIDVPALSEEEIKELARNYNCPQGRRLSAWGRAISLRTHGHPLMTHAHVKSLEAKGWPGRALEDLGPTQDIEDVRREARTQLRERIPSDEARTLAYRLSVLIGRFRRSHALFMGQHPPRLGSPGEDFDLLIGPWVERSGDGYFRLSPLLGNSAEENFTKQEVKALHETAATAFLSEETISPVELGYVLFHGLLGEALKPLTSAIMLSAQIEKDYLPEFSRVIDWFGIFRLQPGEKLFAQDDFMNLMLRRLQFMVVSETDPARAVRVAEVWEREVEGWDGLSSYPASKSSVQIAFLSTTIFTIQVPFPIKTVVTHIDKILILLRENENLLTETHPEMEPPDPEFRNVVMDASNYIRAAVARCKRAGDVTDFLEALDAGGAASGEAWRLFQHDDYLAMLLIDRIWINESKEDEPNWTRCIETLERVAELAMTRRAAALVVAAYRSKAIVQEEYLKDADAALRTIAEGESQIGRSHPLLQDYRAKIYLIEKRHAEAIRVWEEALLRLEQEQNPARIFSYRDVEICAAQLGDWSKAAEFALKGEKAARQSYSEYSAGKFRVNLAPEIAVGFKADYGFALWKLGGKADAVKQFAGVLDDFKHLPDPSNNIKVNMLYKRVGHAIAWLNHDLLGDADFYEPPPGCFSNQEVLEEVEDLPIQPAVLLWFLLAKIEFRLGLGDEIFKRFESIHAKASTSSSKAGYGDLLIGHSLRNLALEDLVSIFSESLKDLLAYAAEQQTDPANLPGSADLKAFLFSALIKAASQNRHQSLPLERWRNDIEKYRHGELHEWPDFIEKCLGAEHSYLVTTLKDVSTPHENRLVTALLISASDKPDAEERFYADVFLATSNFYRSWEGEVENDLEMLVTRGWLRVAERERFSLRTPSLSAGMISRACEDETSHGLRKVARVLLAAHGAVYTKVPEGLLNYLKAQANSANRA